jgi:hypothetical protein
MNLEARTIHEEKTHHRQKNITQRRRGKVLFTRAHMKLGTDEFLLVHHMERVELEANDCVKG